MSENPFLSYVQNATMVTAVAGDGGGLLGVPGYADRIYARLGGFDGGIIEVICGIIWANYDDSLYVILENPRVPHTYRSVFWLRDARDPTTPPPIPGGTRSRLLLLDSDGIQLIDSDGLYLEE